MEYPRHTLYHSTLRILDKKKKKETYRKDIPIDPVKAFDEMLLKNPTRPNGAIEVHVKSYRNPRFSTGTPVRELQLQNHRSFQTIFLELVFITFTINYVLVHLSRLSIL